MDVRIVPRPIIRDGCPTPPDRTRNAVAVVLLKRQHPESQGFETLLRQEIRLARRLLLDQRLSEALAVIDRAEQLRGESSNRTAGMARDLETLRAVVAMFNDEPARALYHARNVQEVEVTDWTGAAARIVCQYACWRQRDFAAFHAVPRHPAMPRHPFLIVAGLCIDAVIELEQMRFSVAKRLAARAMEDSLQHGNDPGVLSALPASLVAQVLYEHGALNEAEAMVRKRLPVIRGSGALEAACRTYRVLVRIAMRRGRMDVALAFLQEAEDLGRRRGWAMLQAMSLFERTRLLVMLGQSAHAQQCRDRLEELAARCQDCSTTCADLRRYCRMAQARVWLAAGLCILAVPVLRQLRSEAEVRCDPYSAAQLALELAGALERQGECQEADELLQQMLLLGSSAGLHQIFIDNAELIKPAMQRAMERAQRPGSPCRNMLPYIGGLLEQKSCTPPGSKLARRPWPALPPANAVDGLSARELDVLMLVCRGLSNKRIAHALTISPETVKAHVKRIFMKLQVESRAQAVFRASSMGLLPAAMAP